MKKVLIIDTSILCVWLKIPGKDQCGPEHDKWDYARVDEQLMSEINLKSVLVLPLASIIETGNHISQIEGNRYSLAQSLAELMRKTADMATPWAAFTDQGQLWGSEGLRKLADEWPNLAATRLSIGDASIKQVAEIYATKGFPVEILTGDQGLKIYEPISKPPIPRRRSAQ